MRASCFWVVCSGGRLSRISTIGLPRPFEILPEIGRSGFGFGRESVFSGPVLNVGDAWARTRSHHGPSRLANPETSSGAQIRARGMDPSPNLSRKRPVYGEILDIPGFGPCGGLCALGAMWSRPPKSSQS